MPEYICHSMTFMDLLEVLDNEIDTSLIRGFNSYLSNHNFVEEVDDLVRERFEEFMEHRGQSAPVPTPISENSIPTED